MTEIHIVAIVFIGGLGLAWVGWLLVAWGRSQAVDTVQHWRQQAAGWSMRAQRAEAAAAALGHLALADTPHLPDAERDEVQRILRSLEGCVVASDDDEMARRTERLHDQIAEHLRQAPPDGDT